MILAQEISAIILIFCMVLAKIRYSGFLSINMLSDRLHCQSVMSLVRLLNFKHLT